MTRISKWMDDFDLDCMSVCASCGDVYGPWRYAGAESERIGEFEQRRACKKGRRPRKELPWPRFDFNIVVELCYCCAAEAIRSGSRWSAFFCERCGPGIRKINHRAGQVVIPWGRHTMMNQLSLSGEDIHTEEGVETLAEAMNGLFERIDSLHQWRAREVRSRIDEDMPLAEYLARASRTRPDPKMQRQRLFQRMLGRSGSTVGLADFGTVVW